MEENCDFRCPQSATYLGSNHITFGMRPFYPFICYIPEAFKNRIISSENRCGTDAVEPMNSNARYGIFFRGDKCVLNEVNLMKHRR